MRLSVSVPFLAMLVGIASACTPGQYSCGAGENANTVMQCGADGIPVPINVCGGGLACKEVQGRTVCA